MYAAVSLSWDWIEKMPQFDSCALKCVTRSNYQTIQFPKRIISFQVILLNFPLQCAGNPSVYPLFHVSWLVLHVARLLHQTVSFAITPMIILIEFTIFLDNNCVDLQVPDFKNDNEPEHWWKGNNFTRSHSSLGPQLHFLPMPPSLVSPSFLPALSPPSILPDPPFFHLPVLHVHHSCSSAGAISKRHVLNLIPTKKICWVE